MLKFTKEELYYIAGLLEGEGSFCINKNKQGRKYLNIQIKMTDYDIIEWVANKWETNIYTETFENHYKNAYTTQLRRTKECKEFLKMIYNMMGTRRKERIDTIQKEIEDNNV